MTGNGCRKKQFYVNPRIGKDSNNGESKEKPFRTLRRAEKGVNENNGFAVIINMHDGIENKLSWSTDLKLPHLLKRRGN